MSMLCRPAGLASLLALTVGVALAQPAYAQSRRIYTASEQNLIASNQYQSAVTRRAYERRIDTLDVELTQARRDAEVARQQVARLRQEFSTARQGAARLQQALDVAEQRAADAQLAFTMILAQRDADYARERRILIESAESLMDTDAGQRFLALANQGDAAAWLEAKSVIEAEEAAYILMADMRIAADLRALAVQWLDKRLVGQETTENVIIRFERVVARDATNNWDWIKLARLYTDVNDLPRAASAAARAATTALDRRDQSVALNLAGDINFAAGDYPTATEQYGTALELIRSIAGMYDDPNDHAFDLLSCYHRLGNSAAAQSRNEEALDWFRQTAATARTLALAQPDDAKPARTLANALIRLGDLAEEAGQLDEALNLFAEALATNDRLLLGDAQSRVLLRDKSVLLERVAGIEMLRGERVSAIARYEQSEAIGLRLLAADPGNAGLQRDRATTLFNLAQLGHPTIGWSQVVDYLAAMARDGTLAQSDQPLLDHARAKLAFAAAITPP